VAFAASLPAGKSAAQQVWKPAPRQKGRTAHNGYRLGNLCYPWREFHATGNQAALATHRLARVGWSEKQAFLSEQSQIGFSKKRSKRLIHNNLRQKMKVVKKRQLEKQSQFEDLSK
jgi:hypothetical protein